MLGLSWRPLNNRIFNRLRAGGAILIGVSDKTTLTLVLLLRASLRDAAFGKFQSCMTRIGF
jgi:hypothetical protein